MRTSPATGTSSANRLGRFWLLAVVTVVASCVDGCECGGTGTSKNKTPPNPEGLILFLTSNVTVMEYGVSFTVDVSRISGTQGAVTVDIQFSSPNGATGGGVDYDTTPAGNPVTLSWNDGEAGTKSFTFTTIDDLVADPDEIVQMTLTPGTGTPTLSGPVQITIADTWIKDPANPVIPLGINGTWNDTFVGAPFVLPGPTQYEMFVAASGSNGFTIGRFLSADGITWGNGGPTNVVGGAAGAFDEAIDDPVVVYDGTGYQMWYTAFSAAGAISIGHVTSANGQTWNIPGTQVFTGSGAGWDATDVAYCHVIRDNATSYRMWYSGKDSAGTNTWAIGYATSTDGLSWTRSGSNPILVGTGNVNDFDGVEVRNPCVMDDNGVFRMFYVGWTSTNPNFEHDIGMAGGSTDGITGWTRHAGNPVITRGALTEFDYGRVDFPACLRIPGATPDQDSIVLYYDGWPDGSVGTNIEIGQAIVP